MSLFTERIAYKPFEYPEYYTEGWLKQPQAFWLHTEISMQGDVKDWNENLLPHEKHTVGNILLGFAQTECAVSDYWTQYDLHPSADYGSNRHHSIRQCGISCTGRIALD